MNIKSSSCWMLEWIWCVLCGIFLARGRRNEKGEDLRSWVLIDDASDGGWRWRGVSRRSWDMQWRWRGVSRGKIWSCGVRRWGRRGCLEWTLILIRVLTWLGKSWVYFLRAPPPPIFNLYTFMKEINTWLEWFMHPQPLITPSSSSSSEFWNWATRTLCTFGSILYTPYLFVSIAFWG